MIKKKVKKEKKQSLIYGVHPIIELIKAKKRKLYTIYTTKPVPKVWNQIEPILPKLTQVNYVSRETLTRLAQTSDHQSVVAWASDFIIRKKFFESQKSPFLVMLDSIQDPRNLGAILRSSYCTGVDGVILITKASAPLGGTALKASAGLAEHLEVYQAPSAESAVIELKKAGYIIYLATLDGKNATNVEFDMPLCLVIGNEAVGISKSILSSGYKITLPQRTADISYNASVAAGILLFFIAQHNEII